MTPATPNGHDRRQFLQRSSSALLGASILPSGAASAAAPARRRQTARADDELRLALVGCGGRGTGAAIQALSTDGAVRLVAMADAFSDRLENSLAEITKQMPEKCDVPQERRFVGFDAYTQAIDQDVDVVLLTTPPGFRPMHFEYAVSKGRHVFMEKPVAVDGSGVRRVLAAAEEAKAPEPQDRRRTPTPP